jgi:hypothetical protein
LWRYNRMGTTQVAICASQNAQMRNSRRSVFVILRYYVKLATS